MVLLLKIILLEHNSYICPNIIFQAASSLGMKKSTAAAPLDCIVPAIFYEAILAPLFTLKSSVCRGNSLCIHHLPTRFVKSVPITVRGAHLGKMTNPLSEHWKYFTSRALNRLCLLAITQCFCIQIVRAITVLCRCNQAAVQDSVSG